MELRTSCLIQDVSPTSPNVVGTSRRFGRNGHMGGREARAVVGERVSVESLPPTVDLLTAAELLGIGRTAA